MCGEPMVLCIWWRSSTGIAVPTVGALGEVLTWQVSNTMDVGFCGDCLTAALNEYGIPEIFNTDQGSQFTRDKWIQVLQENSIKISMDGRGRALDNIPSTGSGQVLLNGYGGV